MSWRDYLDNLIKVKQVVLANRKSFLCLAAIQLLMIIITLIVVLNFQVLLFADLQGILNPLREANLNQNSLQIGNPLLKEMLPLLQNYHQLIKHLYQLTFWLMLLFLIINGWLWVFSFQLIKKIRAGEGLKIGLRMWLKYLCSSSLVILTGSLLTKFMSGFISLENLSSSLSSLWAIWLLTVIILYYLWLLMNANLNYPSWKMFISSAKKTLQQGYKYIHLFLINLLVVIASLYLMFKLVEVSILMAVILGIIVVLIIVITRIFWILVVNMASKQELTEEWNERISQEKTQ